jgi:hypothetical protein
MFERVAVAKDRVLADVLAALLLAVPYLDSNPGPPPAL